MNSAFVSLKFVSIILVLLHISKIQREMEAEHVDGGVAVGGGGGAHPNLGSLCLIICKGALLEKTSPTPAQLSNILSGPQRVV